MKTFRVYVIMLVSLLMASACEKQNVKLHTIVNADGTCTREVCYSNVMTKAVRDSLWMPGKEGQSLPVPECILIDGYKSTHTEVGEHDTVTTTFSKVFESAEDMSKQIPLRLNGVRLKSHASLEKRFRWFYTEYVFTEAFDCAGDSFKIPLTDFVDEEVALFWFTGRPNLLEGLNGSEASEKLGEIEPLVDQWVNANMAVNCLDFIVEHYDDVVNPPVDRNGFVALKDSLLQLFSKNATSYSWDEVGPATFEEMFHSKAYDMFFDDGHPCGQALAEKMEADAKLMWLSVPYVLTMPGKVIDAGNGALLGEDIVYAFSGERLIPQDYVISATSRVTHIWAYVLTILVFILTIASFCMKATSERKR